VNIVAQNSASETVEGTSLSLESVDDVEGSDGLSLGVFSVHDGVTDDVLEESLEDGTSLLVDIRADSLDTTTTSKSVDGRLGDSHDGSLERFSGDSIGASFTGNFSELASFTFSDGTHLLIYF
jgi:hypothetical protein